MEIDEPNYCCPECFEGITVHLDITFDIQTAAHELLSEYKGYNVSTGDAIILEDAIRKCLVEQLGVPQREVM